jgi:hypothetical protein
MNAQLKVKMFFVEEKKYIFRIVFSVLIIRGIDLLIKGSPLIYFCLFFMIWILFGIQINTLKRVPNTWIDITLEIEFNFKNFK